MKNALISLMALALWAAVCCGVAMSEMITFPKGLQQIEKKAFQNDSSISIVYLPDKLQYIGEKAFAYSSIKLCFFPDCFLEIEDDAFEECSFQAFAKKGTDAYEFCKRKGIPILNWKDPIDYSGKLVLYSPLDADLLNAGIAAFESKYPNVEIEAVADGTGNLLNRIVVESASPMADVIWGGSADRFAAYKEYFQIYIPSCIRDITPSLYDPEFFWIGESPQPMVLLVNTDLVTNENIPKTWKDLTDPMWKGKIAIANPASSPSAFTQLCTILMLYGEERDGYAAGWEVVRSLLPNLVVQSGTSKVSKNVDSGAFSIGITSERFAVQYPHDTEDAHLSIIYPEEGTSAVPDSVAIVKDCPNQELAQLFVEFVLSSECQATHNVQFGRRPVNTEVDIVGLPNLDDIALMAYNYNYAAQNTARIIEKWQDILTE